MTSNGIQSMTQENAGGKSMISEAFSISLFEANYGAFDFIFENDVNYIIKYKMVDYICSLIVADQQIRVGVSVSRGLYQLDKQIRKPVFTEDNARHLLAKKLNGLIISQQTINEEMNFYYAILHIWCYDEHIERTIQRVFPEFSSQPEYDNIILFTSISNYDIIYHEKIAVLIEDYDIKTDLIQR